MSQIDSVESLETEPYFHAFEDRKPPKPISYSIFRESIWQFLASLNVVLGSWYIYWRWTESLNPEALWFSIPLVIAETGALIGLYLHTYNLWAIDDTPERLPPSKVHEIDFLDSKSVLKNRVLNIDVFCTTYEEDPELVRLSIQDAKKLVYPYPINIQIYILDDGNRPEMRKISVEENVNYINRQENRGYKAGNLCNASLQTDGDFIVICDADTRLFSNFLENTLGYFRDPKVAWVQTPQWFYDIEEGTTIDNFFGKKFGVFGKFTGQLIQKITGPIHFNKDPYNNDPQLFYDVILRRRNRVNATFCCGAGSVHRREAIMDVALQQHFSATDDVKNDLVQQTKKLARTKDLNMVVLNYIDQISFSKNEATPFKHHISEDILTSILTHQQKNMKKWKSVFHPYVESKMLSPQDLLSWVTQRYRYAAGTLDIMLRHNPIVKNGMTIPQKIMYGATFWSYLGGIWTIIFLISPIVFLLTGVSPLKVYSMDFFLHIIPFIILNEITFMVGQWGFDNFKHKASYISFFPYNIKALYNVIFKKKLNFNVTKKEKSEYKNYFYLVVPQTAISILTVLAITYASWNFFILGEDKFSYTGILTNGFWGVFNIICLSGIIKAAFFKSRIGKKI